MRETMNDCKNVKVRKKKTWHYEKMKWEKMKNESMKKCEKRKNKYWWTDWLTDCGKMKNCE